MSSSPQPKGPTGGTSKGPKRGPWFYAAAAGWAVVIVLFIAIYSSQQTGPLDEWSWFGSLGEWVSGLAAIAAIIWAVQAFNHEREDDRAQRTLLDKSERARAVAAGRERAEALTLTWEPVFENFDKDDNPLPETEHDELYICDGTISNEGDRAFYDCQLVLERAGDVELVCNRIDLLTVAAGDIAVPPLPYGVFRPTTPSSSTDHFRELFWGRDRSLSSGDYPPMHARTGSVTSLLQVVVIRGEADDLPFDIYVDFSDAAGRRWRRRQNQPVELLRDVDPEY